MSTAPNWSLVRAHCEARVAAMQKQLETAPLDKITQIQGAISELRRVLALPTVNSELNQISD